LWRSSRTLTTKRVEKLLRKKVAMTIVHGVAMVPVVGDRPST
jgi:hypothetical protein